jgi:hypothetical protein
MVVQINGCLMIKIDSHEKISKQYIVGSRIVALCGGKTTASQ